jgi:hypothetical protein
MIRSNKNIWELILLMLGIFYWIILMLVPFFIE